MKLEDAKKLVEDYAARRRSGQTSSSRMTLDDAKKSVAEYAKYRKVDTAGVDANYINTYLQDAQDFFRNSATPDDSQYGTWQDLTNRRNTADAWLYKNKNNLSDKDYLSISDSLQTVGSAFDETQSYWDQFDSEDVYRKYVADYTAEKKKQDRIAGMDVDAVAQSKADYDRILAEYSDTTYGLSNEQEADFGYESALRSQVLDLLSKYGYRSFEELSADWDLLDAAKHYQVTKNKDFAKLSQALADGNHKATYNFINDIDGARDAELHRGSMAVSGTANAAFDRSQVDQLKPYLEMTEDEIGIYNYYYATKGEDAALDYLSWLEPTLKERQYSSIITGAAELAEDHPIWASVLSVPVSLGAGKEYLQDSLMHLVTGETDKNTASAVSSTIRGTVSEKASFEIAGWDAGAFAYNTLMSGADSAVAALIPGGAGGFVLGLSAAAAGTNDALERGMSNEQAFWNGLASGVFEGLFETYSIGNFKALKEVPAESFKDIAKNLAKNMLTNATEEMATEVANILYDTLMNGEFANYTWEDLKNGAWEDVLWQIGESGLSGAFMGAGFGTVSGVSSYRNTRRARQAAAFAPKALDAAEMATVILEQFPDDSFAKRMGKKILTGQALSEKEMKQLTEKSAAAKEAAEKADPFEDATPSIEALLRERETDSLGDIKTAAESDSAALERERSLHEESWQEWEADRYRDWGRSGKDFATARAALEKDGGAKIPSAEAFKIYTEAKNEAAAEAAADRVRVTVTESGEDSSVVKVASTAGGNVTVELEGGKRVALSELTFENPDTAVLYTGAATMNAASANSMIEGFDGAADALNYVRGWQEAYNSARYGIDLSESRFASTLTEEQLDAAKRAGEADRKRERATVGEKRTEKRKGTLHKEVDTSTLSASQETAVEALERIVQALGIDIYLYHEANSTHNGWYDRSDGSIHLNLAADLSAEGTLLFTAAHELTHYIRDYAPDKFGTLADFLMEQYGQHGVSVSELVERQMEIAEADGRTIDYDTAFEEVIASSMETMLQSGNVVEAVAKLKAKDATLWEKFAQYFRDLAERLRKAFKGLTPTSREGRYVGAMKDAAERLEELFTDALVTASGRTKNTAEGGVRYQARQSLKDPRQLDPRTVTKSDVVGLLENVKGGAIYGNTYIPIRINTPACLIYWARERRGEIIDNNPIAMSAEKAYQAMARKGSDAKGRPHMLSVNDMVSIIEGMSDPQYIVYQGANDRYVEVVNYSTSEGRKAFAILEVGDAKDSVYMNGYEGGLYNILVTTYPPDAGKLQDLLKNPSNEIVYDKKKDAPQRTSGSTVPSVLNDTPFFIDSIPHESDSVKRKFSTNVSVGDDLYTQLQEIRIRERDTAERLNRAIQEMQNDPEYLEAAEALMDAVGLSARREARHRVQAIEERYQIAALREEKNAAAEQVKRISDQIKAQEKADAEQKEAEEIRQSGLSEEEYHRKKAVKEFGYTSDFKEAGYLLPNGKMLNFSGDKGTHSGHRDQDHRAVGIVYANAVGSEALNRFMREGNVRMMAETPGFEVMSDREPSAEQYKKLRIFVREVAVRGYFQVDLSDAEGRSVGTLSYEGKVNADRVINDLQTFYRTGEIRKQSDVDRFRYSTSSRETVSDRAYTDAVNRGDMETAQKMVDEAAKEAGYDSPLLYHGTQAFGFTEFDPAFSDDGVSLFTTTSDRMAQTYSGKYGRRAISSASTVTNGDIQKALAAVNPKVLVAEGENVQKCVVAGIRSKIKDFENSVSLSRITVPAEYVQALTAFKNNRSAESIERLAELFSEKANQTLWKNNSVAMYAGKIGQIASMLHSDVAFYVQKTDGRIDVLSREEAIRKARNRLEKLHGNYALYAKTDNLLVLDCKGKNWNRLGYTHNGKVYNQTNDVAKLAKAEGYSGVLFKSVVDNGAHGPTSGAGDVYVLFDSSQLKSADPVTYDADGNVIPLSERFNEKQKDIRYSTDSTDVPTLQADNAALRADNDRLVQLLNLQRTSAGGTRFTEESVRAAADHLMKWAGATGNRGELVGMLHPFYEYIARGKNVDWDTLRQRSEPIVDWLSAHRKSAAEVDPEVQDLRRYLKPLKVKLSDAQRRQVEALYGSYNDYRKQLFGTVNLSKDAPLTLDEVWRKMAGQFPGFFDASEVDTDMPGILLDVVKAMRENRLGSEMELALDAMIEQGLYQQVYESYWDAATMRSLGEITDRKIADLKREHKQQMDNLRRRRDEQIQQIRKETELEKEHYRKRAQLKEAEAREKYRKSLDEYRDARERTELRRKSYKVYSELLTLLKDPTKKKHILPELQKAVAEALKVVDMDSVNAAERIERLQIKLKDARTDAERTKIEGTIARLEAQSEKVAERLGVLEEAYKAVHASPEYADEYGAEEILRRIEALKENVKDTTFVHLNRHQLQKLYELFVVTRQQVRNANRLFDDKRNTSVVMESNRIQEEVAKIGKDKNPATDRFSIFRKQEWNNLKPIYAVEKVGARGFRKLFDGLLRGESKYGVDVKESRDYFAKTAKDFGYWKWDQEAVTHHESSDGKPFALNLLQKMSLYAYERRGEVALRHIEGGGLTFDQAQKYTKEVDGKKETYYVRYGDKFPLTRLQVHQITETLTPQQKQFVETMQEYLSKNMGAKGNEVARVLYGIDLFGEPNYFPMQTVDGGKEQTNAPVDLVKLREMGMTQKTQALASNALKLGSFTDVWANHCHQMSLYHSMVLPLEDFTRVFNYTAGGRSVKNELQAVYGKEAAAYFEELLKQLNGGVRADSAELAYSKWLSSFKKAATFFSLSVVIQQRSAIARAYGEILPQYFRKGKKGKENRAKTWAELQKYAGCTVVKEMGNFDVGMGGSSTEWITEQEYEGANDSVKAFFTDPTYRDSKLSRMPALMDEITWCTIWRAVKAETADRNPSLKLGSEEFLKAAGERFTEVISKTQVYDSILSRSANMRSKGGLMKMMTAFMAEPTTAINMFGRGIKMMTDKNTRGRGVRYCASVVAAAIYNSALVSIVYAMRDDDEDETYLEKYVSSFVSETVDSMNPFTYLPFYKDIMSIMQGWDVARSDMTLFTRAKDALLALSRAYEDGDAWKIADAWVNAAGTLTDFFGIPIRNAYRDLKAVWNFGAVLQDDFDTTSGAMGDQVEEGLRQLAPLSDLYWDKDTKSDKLYSAIASGDEEYYQRMADNYDSDSARQSAIRKGLRENEPRIKKAAKAYLAGDMEEYTFLIEQIAGEGKFDEETVRAAVSAEINGERADAKGDDAPDTDDLTAAYESGDNDRAEEIMEELVAAKIEEYLLKAQAEAYEDGESFDEDDAREESEVKARASVRSTLTRYWKPLYVAAYREGDVDECERIEDILTDSGLYGNGKALRKTLKSWRTED